MTRKEFKKLLHKAKTDDKGNLYVEDEFSRIYFGTVQTICSDFVDEYCDEEGECYDRHFTRDDDTLVIHVVNNKKLLKEE